MEKIIEYTGLKKLSEEEDKKLRNNIFYNYVVQKLSSFYYLIGNKIIRVKFEGSRIGKNENEEDVVKLNFICIELKGKR